MGTVKTEMRTVKTEMLSEVKFVVISGKPGVQGLTAAKKLDNMYTQDELNAKFVGPDFHLHLRYAQHLVNFYVAMMYGIGMPILMPIAAVTSFVAYWFDKYMFTHFYR